MLQKRDIRNFSVSQVETFLDCPRKHFFSWILGMKPAATAAQDRGTYVHKSIAENITLKVPPPDEHAIYLRALVPHLPEEGCDFSVEHKLTLQTHLGIPWIGYIDLIIESDPVVLIDWKTTSDMRYAKTPAELHNNLQLIVYAHYAYELGVKGTVSAGLVYIEVPKTPPKRKARVLPIFADPPLRRDYVKAIWDGTKQLVKSTDEETGEDIHYPPLPEILDRMLEVARLDDPQDVPCNTTICGKYGGCPFRTECGISMFSGVAASGSHTPAKNKEISVTFLDRLKNKNGQVDAPPPAVPTPPPPVAAKAAAKPQTTSKPVAAKPESSGPAAAPKAAGGFLARKKAAEVEVGVVPPDAPPRDTMPEEPTNGVGAKGTDSDGDGVTEIGPVPVGDVPKTRGRPKGSTNAKAAETAQARKGFTLYIDTMKVKGAGGVDPTWLEDWFGDIEMVLNELAAEEKQPHWQMLGYGPSKAALAIKVQEKIAKGLPASMIVNSSSPIAREVLQYLIPHATEVYRSLRG